MRVEGRDVYHAAQGARQAWRTLTWQVPALALTAEAVLIGVILDPETGEWGRLFASLFAWVAVTMALQLFLRHSYLQNLTELWVADVEDASDLPPVSDRTKLPELEFSPARRDRAKRPKGLFGWLAEVPARRIWTVVLSVLSCADVLLVLDSLAEIIVGESVVS